jgi:cbb3-type cytochrome oxidase subunit 3
LIGVATITPTPTPEPTLLGLGAGFNPLWLILMIIILGGGGYLALRSAQKKRLANTPSELTLPDESTTEGQE